MVKPIEGNGIEMGTNIGGTHWNCLPLSPYYATAVCTFSVFLQVEGYEETRAGFQYYAPLIMVTLGTYK